MGKGLVTYMMGTSPIEASLASSVFRVVWNPATASNYSQFFFNWFNSAIKYGMNAVLFHDNLSIDMQEKIKAVDPGSEAVHVKPVNNMIANDQRFYFIYDYLLKHPEINMAIATDVRDVVFKNDPHMVMSVIGNNIYAGLDRPLFGTQSHCGILMRYYRT